MDSPIGGSTIWRSSSREPPGLILGPGSAAAAAIDRNSRNAVRFDSYPRMPATLAGDLGATRLTRRSPSPSLTYTDTLIKASRNQRKRSIPPPPPLPEPIKPIQIPTWLDKKQARKKPPVAPRVVSSSNNPCLTRSIYEREPLFKDYCHHIEEKGYSLYNSSHLDSIKKEFKTMVEDKWKRMTHDDPAVERDVGTKLYPWRSVKVKEVQPISQQLADKHHQRATRSMTPSFSVPRLYVYHRSTWSPYQ